MSGVLTTKQEREILEHALGIQRVNGKRTKGGYRNYYCTGPGCADHETCLGLVDKGLMAKGAPRWGDDYFHVTDAGKAEVNA